MPVNADGAKKFRETTRRIWVPENRIPAASDVSQRGSPSPEGRPIEPYGIDERLGSAARVLTSKFLARSRSETITEERACVILLCLRNSHMC